ncbi:MAG: Sua5/YciO/YrdC/YwlC family protein, partial [Candidatus Dormibacteraeota bacterium]|nr:Sua5/YciO/YrdC/YwlC family protein [Candidatus Dormibacteraeota bacterium]
MITTSIDDAASALERGEVIAIPTDTVYGLACSPTSEDAVERIYEIKRRPAALELTLLAATIGDIRQSVQLDDVSARLAQRYWPGPLSIVAPLGERRYAIPRQGDTL